jgi:protoporphyrinogen oxidase
VTARRFVILGAGPTGLGAAWRLAQHGHADWRVYDAADIPGGLAASVVDEQGFTWDIGGHVVFSHYADFDRVLDELLGDAWLSHVRESWVYMRERFIPYPLQSNIWRLPKPDLLKCLEGLLDLHGAPSAGKPANFREWIDRTFGAGLAEVFMLPYNRKVWAYDPSELDVGWMGERVATVDLRRILRNVVLEQDDIGWGPNALFRFPRHGGTGAIWRALHARLPAGSVALGRRAVEVDAEARTVRFSDGEAVEYDVLISTLPLDLLLMMMRRPELAELARPFRHSSTHAVGVGLEGQPPPSLATKGWMYFPEPELPFYRITVFSNYSPENVPEPGKQWSLLCEVSESPWKPVDAARVTDDVVAGLRRAKLVAPGARPVSIWHRRIEHGYPTPWLGRDAVLEPIDTRLRGLGIFSRGRFGAWKYEVSNQDHSFMQGVEAVDHVLLGTEETTYLRPSFVNASKQPERARPR